MIVKIRSDQTLTFPPPYDSKGGVDEVVIKSLVIPETIASKQSVAPG